MDLVTAKSPDILDLTFVKLAREIAMGIHSLDDILANNGVDTPGWDKIKVNARFIQLLESEVAAWNSAINANERVKIKTAVLIEEFLPKLNTRLHDPKESLDHVVKAATLAARLAGMGATGIGMQGDGGERFSVTINLGPDAKFQKEVTSKVIDHEPLRE